ncbi:MAG: hypothetical protein RR980_02680 [Mucinivorans sp.]
MKNKLLFFCVALCFATCATELFAQPKNNQKTAPKTVVDSGYVATNQSNFLVQDSILQAKIDDTQALIKKSTKDINNKLNSVRSEIRSSGRAGNFMISMLKYLFPFVPFVAMIFVAYFWFHYAYKRRVMRQDLIIKYIDRNQDVPEWLYRTINSTPMIDSQDQYSPGDGKVSASNTKTFLVFTIILGCITFIMALIMIQSSGFYDICVSAAMVLATGYATVWCFQQFVKRSK